MSSGVITGDAEAVTAFTPSIAFSGKHRIFLYEQCHWKEYHTPCYLMPLHKCSDADGYPDRKVHSGIRKIKVFIKC